MSCEKLSQLDCTASECRFIAFAVIKFKSSMVLCVSKCYYQRHCKNSTYGRRENVKTDYDITKSIIQLGNAKKFPRMNHV